MRKTPGLPLWMKVGLGGMLLVMVAGGGWFFQTQHRQQRRAVEDRLTAVAELKAKQITDWRKERLADAAVLMERRALIASVRRFFETGSELEAAEIVRRFRPVRDRYDFADILLADSQKQVRLSLSGKTDFHEGFSRTFDSAVLSRKPEWTLLHVDPDHPHPHAAVVAPLFDIQGHQAFIGAAVLMSDATEFLYPLIQTWPTPSDTAETLLIRREGEDVLFLNELRHQKDTALKLRIPLRRADLPAALAVKGKTGIVYGKDYRGVDVVAAILSIPDSPWFMVSKMDASEAFAEWRFRSGLIILLLLGAAAFAGVAGLVFWQRNLKEHYKSLYQSEAALRAAVEKQAVTLRAIGDAVIATDDTGRVELMNPIAEILTGWSEEDARGKEIGEVFRIINEMTREPVKNPVFRVLKEGLVVGLANHTLLIAKDGKEIPIADSGSPVRDENGEIMGVVLVFRDQSEERLARRLTDTRLFLIEYAAERTLEELMTRALDEAGAFVDSPIGFYHFVEPDQKTLSLQAWSTRTLNEFCKAEGKGLHYGIDDAGVWVDCVREKKPVIHNDYASLPHKKGMPEGHAPVIRELVVPVMREGKITAILGVGNKPVDYTEKDAKILSYLADVTWEIVRHKRAEEALHLALERYEKTFQAAPIWVVLSALEDGRYMEVNEAFLTTMGYERKEVIGKTSLELNTWVDPRDREQVVKRIQGEGHVRNLQVQRRTKTGKIIDTLFSAEALALNEKRVMISVTQDITEQKKAEAEREKLMDQLIQAQKMESVGRLAGGVAHDFNNMLGVILGRTEMMLMGMRPGEPHYQDLEEIQKAAKRSADLTRQLLAFARKQTISPKVLNLNDTVEGMLKMLRRLIGEDIHLVWQPDADLWPVKMDPAQIDQILANLCVNARDAISGNGKVTIETENVILDEDYCAVHAGFHPGAYVMLAVSDDGCGMDKETMAHLFEPFFTTKEVGKGTGLGLATIYGIVKQNDGFINVYSEPGKGSTFKIYIPRHEGDLAADAATKPEKIPPGRGETVLLVEDDPGILSMGKKMLERLGYTVLAANSPGEAVDKAKSHPDPIHLLITDVVMPETSGKVLAETIRAAKPKINVLFMSGYTANVIAHHGVLDEGVDFMEKPFSLGTLASKVRKVLDGAPSGSMD